VSLRVQNVDTVNAAAFDLIPRDVRCNPAIFPPSDVVARLPFLVHHLARFSDNLRCVLDRLAVANQLSVG
jgi:hypothetical protein